MNDKKYLIGVLPGDGIGPEVVLQAQRVVDAVGSCFGFVVEWEKFPFGAKYLNKYKEIMPDSALEDMGLCQALLLGAIGDPSVSPGILERGILLKLRFHFDQYINLRPSKSYSGFHGPIPLPNDKVVDSVVVRENTEDFYMGLGARGTRIDKDLKIKRGLYNLDGHLSMKNSRDDPMGMQLGLLTARAVERITRYAFSMAKDRGENSVVLASKANAAPDIYGFLDHTTSQLAESEYPDMKLIIQNVDALCYNLVRNPWDAKVILCPNLFGDIVSDLQAGIVGGLGLSAGANIGDSLSMFEPVHGSAPDIAGTGKANPLAAILSAGLMLKHIGEPDAAKSIDKAVERYLEEAPICDKPIELGGSALCAQVGDYILNKIVRA